jgi:hypothetical protein
MRKLRFLFSTLVKIDMLEDPAVKNYLFYYLILKDPVGMAPLAYDCLADRGLIDAIKKYASSFNRLIKDPLFEEIKNLDVEYVYNDEVGIHAEIKLLSRLKRNAKNDIKNEILEEDFIIGTSLNVCLTCQNVINNIFRPTMPNIFTRKTHSYFCEYKLKKEILIPKIVSELELTNNYNEAIKSSRDGGISSEKNIKKMLDSSKGLTQFNTLGSTEISMFSISQPVRNALDKISKHVILSLLPKMKNTELDEIMLKINDIKNKEQFQK